MDRVSRGYRSTDSAPERHSWQGLERLSRHLKPDGEMSLALGIVGLLTCYAVLIVVGVLLLV